MEIIQVKVDINGGAAALSQIEKIEKAVISLKKQAAGLDVEVDTAGIGAAEKAFGKMAGSAEKAQQKTASFMSALAQNVQYQLVSGAINAMTSAFNDALDTMKKVDDELVTVRKVTGASASELEALEKRAYKTASAYGEAADEYLNSVAAFTRAGYGDQAADLAELATKTKLVGDTSAETAQQFLLSVDAAYKYKGSVEELQKVLDGANEIDNKYATSIEKIAEGLGKVAPIASQAHVGVDELSAAIGTITAVTQRSGTEASTALRALFLNILGDTKTEIDEGVTWTTGEISGLRDVIKLYAKDAYEAAQATGSVINPMEAIAGLSKSMKDGLLTEQKLMSMVSDIGGKLRTSQLLALIQNWDMYESMLSDFGNAAGSADKEVANALDSWTRKTNILKNTWAEFISKTVDTEWIKGLVDDVTWLVDGFGDLGTAVGVFGAAIAVSQWSKILELFGTFKTVLGGLPLLFKTTADGANAFTSAMNTANISLSASQVLLGAVTAAISIGIIALNNYKKAAAENAENAAAAAKKSSEHSEKVLSLYSAYKNAETGTEAFADAQSDLRAALKDTESSVSDLSGALDILTQKQLEASKNDAVANVSAAKKSLDATLRVNTAGFITDPIQGYERDISKAILSETLWKDSNIVKRVQGELAGKEFNIDNATEYYDTLVRIRDILQEESGGNTESWIFDSALYSTVTKQINAMKDGVENYRDALDQLERQNALKQVADDLSSIDIKNADDFNNYIQSIKESSEYSNDFREILLEIANDMFPEYAENADEAAESTDGLSESTSGLKESAEDAGDALEDQKTRIEEVRDALDELSGNLSVAQGAFEDFNENGRLSYDTLSDIIDAFSDLDGLDNYINRLTDASLTGQGLNSILSEMTVALIQQKIASGELTDQDVNLVAAMLESAGVTDAYETAVLLLASAYGDSADAAGDAADANTNFSNTGISTSQQVGAVNNLTNAYKDLIYTAARAEQIALKSGGTKSQVSGLSKEAMSAARKANYYDNGGLESDAQQALAAEALRKKALDGLYDIDLPSGSGGSGGGGGGSSSSEKEEDVWGDKKDALDDLIKAREKVIEIDQREGVSTDELISRYREMQGQVHDLAEEYRAANGVEDDDYTYALKDSYWDLQDKIDKLKEQRQQEELQRYEDEVDLLESELDILKAQDASVEDRAAKMREIAASIKKQIDYLKSIGGDQTEINRLTADWLNMLSDATDLLEEAARERMQELIDAANEMLDALREAQTGALDDQLDRLQSARDTQKQILDIQEKQLAVEKAKIALENAKRERTVRYFNAETNQWEWMADAGKVKDAEESLRDAERNLAEAYADQAYNSAVKQIKTQQQAVKKAYDAFEDAWDDASKSVLDGSMTLAEAFEYMAGVVARIAAQTGVDLSNALSQLAKSMNFDLTTGKEANASATIAATGDVIPIYINEKGQTETKGLVAGDIVHTGAGDYEVTGGSSVAAGGPGYTSNQLFDGGGILRGMGGIKATAQDEMILDPALTSAILSPSADRTFRQRASLLGYLFGAGGQYGAAPGAGTTNNEAVSHNEKIYNFGSISLSEPQAKSMSVYQLARLAGSLHVYANS